MNELQRVYNVLAQIYSNKGYKAGKYIIKADLPSVSKISSGHDGAIEIDFIDNAPVVEVKKIITIRLTVLGIVFKRDEGIIRLNKFPDMSFKYSDELPMSIPPEYFFEQPETD